MESELEKFRRRKDLEQTKEEIKTKFKTTANSWVRSFYQALLPSWNDEELEEEEDNPSRGGSLKKNSDCQPGNSHSSSTKKEEIDDSYDNNSDRINNNNWLMYFVIFCRFLAWLLVYIGFLKIGFGAVFFTLSLLAFIYWNTRQGSGRKRRKGEVSAYSVFNKDCQSIDGTLKAEHLEKQLLYRS